MRWNGKICDIYSIISDRRIIPILQMLLHCTIRGLNVHVVTSLIQHILLSCVEVQVSQSGHLDSHGEAEKIKAESPHVAAPVYDLDRQRRC